MSSDTFEHLWKKLKHQSQEGTLQTETTGAKTPEDMKGTNYLVGSLMANLLHLPAISAVKCVSFVFRTAKRKPVDHGFQGEDAVYIV